METLAWVLAGVLVASIVGSIVAGALFFRTTAMIVWYSLTGEEMWLHDRWQQGGPEVG